MNIQGLIAALIILAAAAYVGSVVWKKVRAMSPKSGCGEDCGCGSGSRKVVQ